ncbi:MAG TPA: M28 family peptidase, partial [Hyphomonadaceae bacterium]|nr:M28 family peptidase [Hyphomonadaceae bacterium]
MTNDNEAPKRPANNRAIAALGVFALLFVLFFSRALPLTLDPVRATNAPDQFDAQRAVDRLSHVLDGTPHPVDSAPLDDTRGRLLTEIRNLGYEPEVHDQTACRGSISGSAIRCARVQNVTFTAGPTTGPTLVLTAHYDSVEASPGFGDDGIGVAVWLEVAKLLKDAPPSRPVLFLLTDGEETALLGAQAFVDAKAYGRDVGRIINLEARGVRGPAMMFETGHPNGGIVSDWAKNGARLFANSMMTAVYEKLPNSTDLTVHLHNGWTGVNIAIADGLDFYHTQHDDLAHLDRTSVQQMGDQALGAARAFIGADWSPDKSGGEIAYTDIASRIFVELPQVFTLVLLGLCFGISAMLLVKPTRQSDWRKLDWRALALPPALLITSGLLAFLAQAVIGLIRPEGAFWTAYPQALNCVIFLASLLLSSLGLGFIAKTSSRETLFASGWFWFLLVGMGLSLAVPGFSMLFLVPGAVFVVCAAVAWLAPRYAIFGYAIASAVLVIMFFPILQLLDVMMGLSLAAMFGVVEALVLAPMLALVGPIQKGQKLVAGVLGAALIVAMAATALLPAFSVERPLPLNFNAVYDIDARTSTLYASATPGALPKAIGEQLKPNAAPPPPGVTATLASRPLTYDSRVYATAALIGDETTPAGRIVHIQLTSPGARMARVRIPASAHPTQLKFNNSVIAMRAPQAGFYIIDIVGRGADGAVLDFTLAPPEAGKPAPEKPAPWTIQGYWTQLPAEAQRIADARP